MKNTTVSWRAPTSEVADLTRKSGLDLAICDLLAAAPGRTWSVREILEALDESYSLNVSRRCVVLWHSGRIERVSAAQYRHRIH